MILNDAFIDLMADFYRKRCGDNDVLIVNGRIITFEQFLQKVLHIQARRLAA